MTPVLHSDGTVPYDKLMRQFAERDENSDRVLTTLVLRKLAGSRRRVDAGSFSERGLYLVTRRLSCEHGTTHDPVKTMTISSASAAVAAFA
jgi:hypothetical protein